jgi:hypothetical protein
VADAGGTTIGVRLSPSPADKPNEAWTDILIRSNAHGGEVPAYLKAEADRCLL